MENEKFEEAWAEFQDRYPQSVKDLTAGAVTLDELKLIALNFWLSGEKQGLLTAMQSI